MSYTMQDLLYGVGGTANSVISGMTGKLSYRSDTALLGGLQDLADGILELSRDYRFPKLEVTGPLVYLVVGQSEYPSSYFTVNSTDIANLIPSFYMNYQNNNYPPTSNSGVGLTWKSIDTLELMMQTEPSQPAYFTRYGDNFYLAPTPSFANPIFLRYQQEHPFSHPVALTDPFLLPNDWREIAEYAGALRFAQKLRMLDYATQYHNQLFGDPAQPGKLGLIAQKISQIQGDSTSNTAMRQIRVMINRY